MKKKWIASITFTMVLGIGITIYCLFFEQNKLSGVTSNGNGRSRILKKGKINIGMALFRRKRVKIRS
ncbi:hypothetical protein MOB49_13940 [Bacillus haynesii]|uniref:hypothetical protein n=1 Tax=Bacillus haynesii TaxID=1925021 RepID=UPI001305E41B|nr:hypothetical protein [Bacillus haynesii]TWK14611.1 hypothetical protein CHCC20375_1662 [Bacillus licheniformis]MCY7968176.1 hypothetical protein [Bacillus haynesii]MCY8377769.1 hypothetical protein [Bacillus haynesii]MCY8392334.1 hypothetical protein [Bacillus haynesii]MCY8543674.1 hypothetical protein [Bacillus haynesii]